MRYVYSQIPFVVFLLIVGIQSTCALFSTEVCFNSSSRNYMGTISYTISGRECQRWDERDDIEDHMFPDGWVFLANNYCRILSGKYSDRKHPWCFTTDPSVPWELCPVPRCSKGKDDYALDTPTKLPMSPGGCDRISFLWSGSVSETTSGRQCQAWTSNQPHPHVYHDSSAYPDTEVADAKNFCRDPDGSGLLWCYTTDPTVRFESCPVPACGRADCFYTSSQYKGTISHTLSGRRCMRWDDLGNLGFGVGSPGGSSGEFPGSEDENYCRDPDGRGAPWCFIDSWVKKRDTGESQFALPPRAVGPPILPPPPPPAGSSYDWEYCPISRCPAESCYKKSRKWQGKVSFTRTGRPCQRWDRQRPNSHQYTDASMYPDRTLADAANYCRDPDNSGQLWCYTDDPIVRWEYCAIPKCSEELCWHNSEKYKGTIDYTLSGRTCQRWNMQTPHRHSHDNKNYFPDASVRDAQNYCRNPRGSGRIAPWCYTEDTKMKWEYCQIPRCPNASIPLAEQMCFTDSTTWKGKLSRTLSGKTCQRWDSQFPHSHGFDDPADFPDGTLMGASNNCRDPDRHGTPWCYTTDPNQRWEECDVPPCEEDEDCFRNSKTWTGKVSQTLSGRTCQRWESQFPHIHTWNKPEDFPDNTLLDASNYCRDPNGNGRPWCFTTDSDVRWEECGVPECEDSHEQCYTNSAEWMGTDSVTVSGITCQRWDTNYPHRHQWNHPDYFPDQTLLEASNYCRDPFGLVGQPWCYTTDPNRLMDICGVSRCN